MKSLLKAIVVAGFLAASLVAVAPAANAVTEHCPVPAGSVKVELDGSSNTVQTNLAPGTSVCVKAGTEITYVTVAADGTITQTAITNKNGTPLGISYYVGIPCTNPYGCGTGS